MYQDSGKKIKDLSVANAKTVLGINGKASLTDVAIDFFILIN